MYTKSHGRGEIRFPFLLGLLLVSFLGIELVIELLVEFVALKFLIFVLFLLNKTFSLSINVNKCRSAELISRTLSSTFLPESSTTTALLVWIAGSCHKIFMRSSIHINIIDNSVN